MSITVMSRHVQYSLNSRPSSILDEKDTLLYDVLKSHSKMDLKLQAWKELDEIHDDQGEYFQDFQHDDRFLSAEFAEPADEPILWSYDADTLTPLEYDENYADHVTARGDDDDDDDDLFVQLADNEGEPENDFDVDLYAGSALIAAQTNTEDDFTTSYYHYTDNQYNNNYNAHSHNHNGGDVLDNDYDLSICEYQDDMVDGDDDDTYSDTTISIDSKDDENDDDDVDDEIFEEKKETKVVKIALDIYNPDGDDVVLLVDQLLGDDELLTLQGSHFLHL
jgi:hypothetical protein